MDNAIAIKIANLALKSMLYEVCATPKPGLVDLANQGAHNDMDAFTFIDSSMALFPTMYQCAFLGLENCYKLPQENFSKIRQIGIQGEKDMFTATKGVNTQKGLIFALGTICAALGMSVGKNKTLTLQELTSTVKAMTTGLVERELKKLNNISQEKKLTAGEFLYHKYGVRGIRGEVEEGFPTVQNHGLPVLRENMKTGLTINDCLITTLLQIMLVAEDTNVLWRAGKKGLEYMRLYAGKAVEAGGIKTKKGRQVIAEMNGQFIQKNISPGGCADLLAVTVMFYMVLEQYKQN